jgi:hypothetical protein
MEDDFVCDEYTGNFKNTIFKMVQPGVYSFTTITLRLMVLCESVISYSDENTILLKAFRFFLQMKIFGTTYSGLCVVKS